jgi:hypothetical protein
MDVEKFTVSDVLSPLANSAIANESFTISKDILRLMPQSNPAMAGFQLHSVSEALKPLMSASESIQALLRTGPALQSVLVSTAELSERLRAGMTVAQSTVAFSKDLQAHYANLASARSPLIAAERMLEAYSTVQSSLPALREIEMAVREIASTSETLYSVSSLIRQDNFIRLYTDEIRMLTSNRAIEFLAEQTRFIHEAFRPTFDAFSIFRDTSVKLNDDLGILRMPVREHFLTTDLLHVLTERPESSRLQHEERVFAIKDAEEQMLLTLPDALSELDSDLHGLWRGAWDAFISDNSDRTRHALVSARELVTRVLHMLSPDEEIKKWSTIPGHFDERGRPTRKARLLFIYSGLNDGPMRGHFEKEIEASLSLVNLFQRGTHEVRPAFSDEQVRAILRRVHSTICAMVEAHKAKMR